MPMPGCPKASWLRLVESYLRDMVTAGLAFAWAMARRKPNGVPSLDGHGDALLRRVPPYMT